jgi:ArsR family transcriptional regulator
VGTVPDDLLEETARRFRLLGDATRLRLLNALQAEGELAVSELAERSGASIANASKHLANLQREGIVARRRTGTTVRYRIADPTVAALCELVCAGLRERYAGLARLGADAA